MKKIIIIGGGIILLFIVAIGIFSIIPKNEISIIAIDSSDMGADIEEIGAGETQVTIRESEVQNICDYVPIRFRWTKNESYEDVTIKCIEGTTNVGDNCTKDIIKTIDTSRYYKAPIEWKCKPVAYNISGSLVQRYYHDYGCYSCKTNRSIITCYDYKDGYSDFLNEEWYCKCKEGTSCKQVNIATKDILYDKSDTKIKEDTMIEDINRIELKK